MNPQSQFPLTNIQKLNIALKIGKTSQERRRLKAFHWEVLEPAAFEAHLKAQDVTFDYSADSFQRRMVAYLTTNLGFSGVARQFKRAKKAGIEVLRVVRRQALTGLHQDNEELSPLIKGFTAYELYLLQNVVIADNRSQCLQTPEMIDLIIRKLGLNRGEDLIAYLAARMALHDKRMKRPGATLEVLNYNLMMIGTLWTAPDGPLWLMPSAGAVKIINHLANFNGKTPLTGEAYNSLVRSSGLHRLQQAALDKFISQTASDPVGMELRRQLENTMGINLATVRRGRPARPRH